MPHDKDANSEYGNLPDPRGQSQDAVRHDRDALHHKFPKGPRSGSADEVNASRDRAQRESIDTEPDDAQPREVPRVGSRDAPGG